MQYPLLQNRISEMLFNKQFKMRMALLVFIVLSITLTGNEGGVIQYTPSDRQADKARQELFDVQTKNILLLRQLESKLNTYELTRKNLESK